MKKERKQALKFLLYLTFALPLITRHDCNDNEESVSFFSHNHDHVCLHCFSK